jgi:hypothetical protein
MPVTLDSTSAPFLQCGCNLNEVLTVATLVGRNADDAMGAPVMGISDVWSQVVGSLARLERGYLHI